MKIVGCDLHARQQSIAMVDSESGELTEKTLSHEGNAVREFYAALEGPVVVGIEATGAMQRFLELLQELDPVAVSFAAPTAPLALPHEAPAQRSGAEAALYPASTF